MERLNRYLASCGVASRRGADVFIKAGRITVNGRIVSEPYMSVDPLQDNVCLDGKAVKVEKKIYIALYKPVGYISDLADPRGRKLARSLIPLKDNRLFPVGRLDYNSEGLIIFTNDGDLAQSMSHPKFGFEKEYMVKFQGVLSRDALDQISRGVHIDGVLCKPTTLEFVGLARSNGWYRFVVIEGKNRMIRRIGESVNHRVMKLKRTRLGPIVLGDMKPGEFRVLSGAEVRALASAPKVTRDSS